jgi:hypothetical protein
MVVDSLRRTHVIAKIDNNEKGDLTCVVDVFEYHWSCLQSPPDSLEHDVSRRQIYEKMHPDTWIQRVPCMRERHCDGSSGWD